MNFNAGFRPRRLQATSHQLQATSRAQLAPIRLHCYVPRHMHATWSSFAERSIAGEALTRAEAHAVLDCPDEELLALLDAAYRVRLRFHGKKLRLHVLANAKSGACPEDCKFCSQSSAYQTPADVYPMQSVDEIVEGARRAKRARAWKYCIVTATRGPSRRDLDTIGFRMRGDLLQLGDSADMEHVGLNDSRSFRVEQLSELPAREQSLA